MAGSWTKPSPEDNQDLTLPLKKEHPSATTLSGCHKMVMLCLQIYRWDETRRGGGVGWGRRGGYGFWHNVLVRQCTTVNPAAKKKNCGYCPFSFVHLPLLWSCAVPIQCLVRFIKVQLYSRVNITFAHVPSGLAPNLQYKTSSLYGHLDSILPFWTLLPTTNRPVTGSRSAAAHNLWLSYMSLSCFMYFTTYQTL